MAYTPVTSVQSPELTYFQWSRPNNPNPRLSTSIDADDTTIYFTDPPKDKDGAIIALGFLMGIEKNDGYVETVYVPAGALSVDGLTATGCVRGVRLQGLDVTTGDSSLAVAHNEGEKVFCNITGVVESIIMGGLTASLGANIKFNGRMLFLGSGVNAVPVFANSTARDAAITSPANGDQCYLTNAGLFYDYTAGSWVARASGGSFPNGDATTAGKFELATQSENNAGTSTGSSATLIASPNLNAVSIQNSVWNYVLDTGAANAYVATIVPAITALVTGQRIYVKIANANTGASTLNVNGLGVKTIKKNVSSDLAAGDLPAGIIAEFVYDGTYFQLANYPPLGVGIGETDALMTSGTIGETFSSSDISNNRTLAYMNSSDGKWYKVTSSSSTWYGRLGIVLQAGVNGDVVKILLKGKLSGQSFSSINPSFSSSLTGSDNNVGDTTAKALRAFVINNTTGAEAVVTGGTISARQQGTPSGAMQIYLILGQQETTDSPSCFRDATNNVARGSIIGSATIAQALFSGTYQNLSFSFGANVLIPAGSKVYLVIGKTGAVDAANYYQVQSNAATLSYSTASPGWSGAENAGNLTLTVTSTSPVGYAVKAYTGTNGTFGLTPSNAWSRCIGRILSSTEMYFDPEHKRDDVSYNGFTLKADTASGFAQITTGFCPSSVRISATQFMDATTDSKFMVKGIIRGDKTGSSTFQPVGWGNGSTQLDDYLAAQGSGAGIPVNGGGSTNLRINGINQAGQNILYLVRLENGFYIHCGYPTGANFISVGAAGYVRSDIGFELESKI